MISVYKKIVLDISPGLLGRKKRSLAPLPGHRNAHGGDVTPWAISVLGAKVVERHFTLDRTMKGGDHAVVVGTYRAPKKKKADA